MTLEQGKQPPSQLETQLSQNLNRLRDENSSNRNALIFNMLKLYANEPKVLLDTLSLLEEPLSGVYCADKLYKRLNNENNINNNLCNPEYLTEMITHINGPQGERVEELLLNLIAQPVNLIRKRKNPNTIKEAYARAAKITNAFAKAFMTLEEKGEKEDLIRSLELFHNNIANFDNPEIITLSDLLYLATIIPDSKAAVLADISMGTIFVISDVIESDLSPEIFQSITTDQVLIQKNRMDELIKILGGNVVNEPIHFLRTYVEDLDILFDYIKNPVSVIEDNNLITEGYPNHYHFLYPPLPSPMAKKAILRKMKQVSSDLESLGYDSEIIPFPGGANFLMMWRRGKSTDKQQKKYVQKQLIDYFQHLRIAPYYESQIDAKELGTLIRFFGPDFDYKKTLNEKKKLEEVVKSGWHTISRGGVEINFELEEERWIRELGIEQMIIKQKEQKIDIQIIWSICQIDFSLDREYILKDLEDLPSPQKDWLTAFVFSYLAAIKNPEEEFTYTTKKARPTVRKSKDRKTSKHPAHLRALPVGWEAHIDMDDIEKVRFHFGIELDKLNDYFLKIQEQMMPISKLLEDEPYKYLKAVYKKFLIKALTKIIPREEKPRWHQKGVSGPEIMLENPIIGLDKLKYQITYVNESDTDKVKSDPKQNDYPGVGTELRELNQK